jgi:putative transposase
VKLPELVRQEQNYFKSSGNSPPVRVGMRAVSCIFRSYFRRKIQGKQKDELVDMIINKTPVDVGFPASFNWTAKIVRDYIKKAYDIKYTIRGMTKVLKRLGLSFTRPTYTLTKADPEKQRKFKEDFKIFHSVYKNGCCSLTKYS